MSLKLNSALVTLELIHCLPKFCHPYVHLFFYENISTYFGSIKPCLKRILMLFSINDSDLNPENLAFCILQIAILIDTSQCLSSQFFCYCVVSKWQNFGRQWMSPCVTSAEFHFRPMFLLTNFSFQVWMLI